MSRVKNQPIILPPAYFPPVPWIGCLLHSGEAIIDVHSWYKKQQLSSRTWIKGPDGPVCLTIPIERRGSKAPFHQKKVSYQENWPETHFRSLKNFYNNSPYFAIWEEELRIFFDQRPVYLTEWIENALNLIMEMSGSYVSYTWSEEYHIAGAQELDMRNMFPPSPDKYPDWFIAKRYQQVFDPFSPGLSILDLLFSRGRESDLIAKSGIRL